MKRTLAFAWMFAAGVALAAGVDIDGNAITDETLFGDVDGSATTVGDVLGVGGFATAEDVANATGRVAVVLSENTTAATNALAQDVEKDIKTLSDRIDLAVTVEEDPEFGRWKKSAYLAAGEGSDASAIYSTALGIYNTASENSASALGHNNMASGASASAVGDLNKASAGNASAVGTQNTASGEDASAFGYKNTASGKEASAFGYGNKATDEYSAAFGINNSVNGYQSAAFGIGNTVTDEFSVAVGRNNNVYGYYATALGLSNGAHGDHATAIGYGNYAYGNYSTALGYRAFASNEWANALAVSQTPDKIYLGSTMDDKGETAKTLKSYFDGKADASALTMHTGNENNPHKVTAAQIGALTNEVEFAAWTNGTSIAAGRWAQATGTDSVAIGNAAKARFESSVAIGDGASAGGNNPDYEHSATAIGSSAKAMGHVSTAIGYSARAEGENSTALGYDAFTSNEWDNALGLAQTPDKIYLGSLNDGTKTTGKGKTAKTLQSYLDERATTNEVNALSASLAATTDDLEATKAVVYQWEGFLDGSNVVFSITNYISGSYNIDTAKLRILELKDGEYHEVYNSRDEILAHLDHFRTNEFATATNSVISEVDSKVADKADKAWGKYTSAGSDAPSNTVWMTAPSTVFAGGMEYQRVAVGEGAVCFLVDRGAPVRTQGDEGVFKFQDDGGTNYFGFAKTDSYTIGADADGIDVSTDSLVTLTYSISMNGVPCVWYKAELGDGIDWVQLNLPDGSATEGAPVAVSWDDSPPAGKQVCYVNCSGLPSGFFKATVEVAGSAKFITNMPADLSAGIVCTNTATGVNGVIAPIYNGTGVSWTWKEIAK